MSKTLNESDLKEKSNEELVKLYKTAKQQAKKFNTIQMAKKIALNSCYGSLGNPYSRYYDLRLATSITMSGQLAIRYVGDRINRQLNHICETNDFDYVVYTDTDSVAINAHEIIKNAISKDKYESMSEKEIIEFMQNLGLKLESMTDLILSSLGKTLNATEQCMKMECEAISNKAIWTGKKRYVLRVIGDPHTIYSSPKEKIMGLEIKRSSTPDIVKPMLEKSIQLILDNDIDAFRSYVDDCRKKFNTLDPEDIAFPRGVSHLTKYVSETQSGSLYKKATPIAVRAAILYNHLIDKHDINSKYSKINDGSKIKFIFLKEPNTIQENVIGFTNSIPEEFDLEKYIDRDTQFEKAFLDPVDSILKCIGWELVEAPTLF